MIKQARKIEECERLIVVVNNDRQVKLKRSKVFMNEVDRKQILESIKGVDEVYISVSEDKSICMDLEILRPDIFANGGDRHQEEIPEAEVCRQLGIEMIDGLGDKIRASSEIIKKHAR